MKYYPLNSEEKGSEGKIFRANEAEEKSPELGENGPAMSRNRESEEKRGEEKRNYTLVERNIFRYLVNHTSATYAMIADNVGVGETTVFNTIRKFKIAGLLKRENGRKHGVWVVTGEMK